MILTQQFLSVNLWFSHLPDQVRTDPQIAPIKNAEDPQRWLDAHVVSSDYDSALINPLFFTRKACR